MKFWKIFGMRLMINIKALLGQKVIYVSGDSLVKDKLNKKVKFVDIKKDDFKNRSLTFEIWDD